MKPRDRKARSGFTVIEAAIATTLFAGVGLTLAGLVRLGDRTQGAVSDSSTHNAALVRAMEHVRGDLAGARASTLVVTNLPDGAGHEVTFEVPVEVGGVEGWGAFDPALGPAEADQNQPGWTLRFTVDDDPSGDGRRLLRQVVDADRDVVRERVLTRALASDAPGFELEEAGDMWRVVLRLRNNEGTRVRVEEFDVRIRN